jgi:RimJ/RimL family protein N-acetyltransferase
MDILVTKRLTLRPPLEVDIDDITEAIGNPNVSRMLDRVPYPYFRKDAEDWLDHVTAEIEADQHMAFTIHRERLIGAVTLSAFDEGAPVLGYWLAEPAWGKGYATDAAAAIIAHAFNTRQIETVKASVAKANPASLNVQIKLGFKLTGEKNTWSLSRGEMVESWTTELTRRDFANAGHPAGRAIPVKWDAALIADAANRDCHCL